MRRATLCAEDRFALIGAPRRQSACATGQWRPLLLFADKVATAGLPHARRMYRTGGDVAALARAVGCAAAGHGQGHLAVQDDVRRLGGVRVVGIAGVRAVLPDVRVREAFRAELLCELCGVFHGQRLTLAVLSGVAYSLGANMRAATRVTRLRGASLCDSTPSQLRVPEITRDRPAASACSPTRATFSAVSLARPPTCEGCPAASKNSLVVDPGQSAQTFTPWRRTSSAMPSAKSRSNPLVAA